MSDQLKIERDPSDLGGVAARDGFKYQDHVAVLYALDMLINPNLKGVRCELTDDIDLIWSDCLEYVQVKKTEKDKNWTLEELATAGEKGKKSILQKSLACDCGKGEVSKFRIVTRRGVNATLKHLTAKSEVRGDSKEKQALVKSIKGKLKGFTSENGNGAEFWVTNCFWEIIASNAEAFGKSYQKITKYAQTKGCALFDDDVREIYRNLLNDISDNADKSNRIHTVIEKTYDRASLISWMNKMIEECQAKYFQYKKVYKNKKECVFVELVNLKSEKHIRNLHSFIVEYSRKKYRYLSIVNNLLNWMPEFLLMPNELAEHSSDEAFKVWSKTIDKFKDKGIDNIREFLSELIFHILLRSNSNSEPISGCLFVDGKSGLKTFNNVHIIDGYELCLGVSFSAEAHEVGVIPTQFASVLSQNLDPEIFDESRQKYFDLKNDNFLSSHNIDELLNIAANIEDNFKRFRFAALIFFDSTVLVNGYIDEYKEKVKEEVKALFDEACASLQGLSDDFIDKICVYIYLVPIESINKLEAAFLTELKLNVNE